MDPDDIMGFFFQHAFGGGMPRNRNFHHRQRQRHHHRESREEQETQQNNNRAGPAGLLFQFLPLLLILLLSFSSGLFTQKKTFSFEKKGEFVYEQKSFRIGAVFYTDKSYAKMDSREKYNLNVEVEQKFLNNLQEKCSTEWAKKVLSERELSRPRSLQWWALQRVFRNQEKSHGLLTATWNTF